MLRKSMAYLRHACLTLLLACTLQPISWAAAPDGLSEAQAAALEQRVRERWQAVSSSDYGKAWEFSTPVYRSVFPKDLYVLQFSYAVDRQLTGVEVTHYDAAAAVASVTARVMSTPLKQTSAASVAMGALPVTAREKWVLIGGEWFFSI